MFDGHGARAAVRARGGRTTRASGWPARRTAANVGLRPAQVERPYRALLGEPRPGAGRLDAARAPGDVRVYGKPGAKATVEVRCSTRRRRRHAPTTYRARRRDGSGRARDPGDRARRPSASPTDGHADLTLETGRSATVDGPPIGPEPGPTRDIGLALSGVNGRRPARPARRRITACPTYHEGSRRLQDRFDTRRLADRIDERIVHDTIDEDDRAFIEARDMFFIATADAEGRPQCSYKGGEPGLRARARRADDRLPGLRRQRHVPDRRERRSSTRTSGCSSSTSRAGSGCG